MLRIAGIFVGLVIGGSFFYLATKDIDLAEVNRVVGAVPVNAILQLIFLTSALLVVKAARWRVLLRPLKTLGVFPLVPSVVIGAASNSILSHSGELARIAIISRRYGISSGAIFATIAVERVLDVLAVGIILGSVLVTQAYAPNSLVNLQAFAVLFAIAAVAIALFLVAGTKAADRVLARLAPYIPRQVRHPVSSRFRSFREGLSAIQGTAAIFLLIVWSIVQWAIIIFCIHVCLIASNVDVGLPAAAIVMIMTMVGLSLPTAPAYLGTLQAAFVFGLVAYNTAHEDAIAASLLYNAAMTLPVWIAATVFVVLQWRVNKAQNDSTVEPQR